MAGGTFVSQNKTRPGAYINFEAVAQSLSSIGSRGIMTMPVAMKWGATITELLSTDLVDGSSLEKIGYVASDDGALIFREALKNAYKAIVYRLDTGSTKAVATIDNLIATALYGGTVGNDLTVAVITNGAYFDVVTYYNGAEKDRQTVADITGLVDNAWVVFSTAAVTTLLANAGVALAGATDGVVVEGTYTTYMDAMKSYSFNTMGIPYDVATLTSTFETYIDSLRNDEGKKCQIVLYDVETDNEGIISVAQGYVADSYTVSPTEFVAYVAGLTAGSEADESNTYHLISDAVSIEYPSGVTPYTHDEIVALLGAGQFILSTRQDGGIVVEQDINTFHTFTPTKGYSFSKNRVIRTLDEIANSTSQLFENSYIGKVDNDATGRSFFKADLIKLINDLQDIGAVQNFAGGDDIDVSAGTAIDAVVVDMAIQPVDAMEKLYMTVVIS